MLKETDVLPLLIFWIGQNWPVKMIMLEYIQFRE